MDHFSFLQRIYITVKIKEIKLKYWLLLERYFESYMNPLTSRKHAKQYFSEYYEARKQ